MHNCKRNNGGCPNDHICPLTDDMIDGDIRCPWESELATPNTASGNYGGTPLLQMEDGTVIVGGFNPPSQEEVDEMLARLKSMRIALDPIGEAHKVGGGFFAPPKPKTPEDLKLAMQKLAKEIGKTAQAHNEFCKAFGDLLALINKEIQDYVENKS